MGDTIKQAIFTAAAVYFLGPAGAGVLSAGAVTSALVAISLATVSSYLFAPKIPAFGDLGTRDRMVRQPITSRKVIYGRQKVSGPIVALGSTEDDKYLHLVIAVAGHEIQQFESFYVDDIQVTLDSNNMVTNYQYKKDGDETNPSVGTPLIKIRSYLGTSTQTSDADLQAAFPGIWTTNHRLQGIAYIYARLEFDAQVFQGGIPNISCVIRGKKVYDYRDLTTKYTANPALILADYLRDTKYGLGCGVDELDTDAVIASANICDEDVPLATSGTEKRYECHGLIDTDKNPNQIIEEMLTSMAGQMSYIGGKWTMRAGAYVAPAMTLTLDDLRGPIQMQTKPSRSETFNAVKGVFINPDANWQATDYPPITSATFEAEDNNQRVFVDYTLPFTTSNSMAQRIAKIALYRSRQEITMTLPCKLKAFDLKPGDTVNITIDRYGFSSKVFEVVNWRLAVSENQLGVDLELREMNSAVFDWDAEETAFSQDNATKPNSDARPPTLTNLAVTDNSYLNEDGTFFPSSTISWDSVPSIFVTGGGYIEIQFKKSSDTVWTPAANVPGNQTSTTIDGGESGINYDIRARTKTSTGVDGAWAYVNAYTIPGDTTAPGAPTSLTATGSDAAIQLTWVNPADKDYAFTEIYENTTNTSGTSVKIATISGTSFTRAGLGSQVLRYYWAKSVDFSGNVSAFSTGASASTNDSPSKTPRTDSGYIYYGLSSASTPSAPTATGYDFSTGTFSSLTSNWSTTFSAPDGGGEFWAVRFTVNEDSFGGAQTVNLSSVFKWQNFDGIVTFSNIEDSIDNNVTIIDGGKITTNTLSAATIKSDTTKSANNGTFGLGTGTTLAGLTSVSAFSQGSTGNWAILAANTAGGSTVGAGTTATSGAYAALVAVGYGNSSFSTYRTQGNLAEGNAGGHFLNGGANNIQSAIAAEIRLAYYTGGTAYAYYIDSGSAYPFTAGHDALQLLSETIPDEGDLMVDVELISAPNINDSITKMSVSTSANQKGVSGIFVGVPGDDFVPASLSEYVPPGDGETTGKRVLRAEFASIFQTYRPLAVNAIGEGKINVCGQNGNIEIGDLIVASDMPGKGMKQDDDVVKSYTVAKAREEVVFSDPSEVKQIACIYMCG